MYIDWITKGKYVFIIKFRTNNKFQKWFSAVTNVASKTSFQLVPGSKFGEARRIHWLSDDWDTPADSKQHDARAVRTWKFDLAQLTPRQITEVRCKY